MLRVMSELYMYVYIKTYKKTPLGAGICDTSSIKNISPSAECFVAMATAPKKCHVTALMPFTF